MSSIPIPGCRHDVFGHNLKAIGILRALAQCAETAYADPEAEAWWDMEDACFRLRSEKYSNEQKLVEFFAHYYRPTPIFSPWNTGGGLDEKQEIILAIDQKPLRDFLQDNDLILREHGFRPGSDRGEHSWKDGRLVFELKGQEFSLKPPEEIKFQIEQTSGRRPKKQVVIQWAPAMLNRLSAFVRDNLEQLEQAVSISKSIKGKLTEGSILGHEVVFTIKSLGATHAIVLPTGLTSETRTKVSGEKAVIAVVQSQMATVADVVKGIEVGRRYFVDFQNAATPEQMLFESFRDEMPDSSVLALDAILTSRTGRTSNNPLFLKRGEAGNSEIFRSFWSYFLAFKANPEHLVSASLFPCQATLWGKEKSPGTPFFPDAIKTYNNGLGWVVETFPFNALDYLLAVEGALALRGTISRSLSANSRRFAAFPFVFDSGEDLVDDSNEVKEMASSIWLPLWNRSTSFSELSSFIGDAQARLPSKEARFSAEFTRALRTQGVDAGFSGWQEFRFKMKASRIPWICTGRYIGAVSQLPALLTDGLAPLDESRFLDQFEPLYKGSNIDSRSPHSIRGTLNGTIENAAVEPTAANCLEILVSLYDACRKLAISKTFRENISKTGQRTVFFEALPQEPWKKLLEELDHSPEFRIARALAAITGFAKQSSGKFSAVQPFLGSLLPIKRGANGWYLPSETKDLSKQAVWSSSNPCFDLSRVLSRRYLDSLDDDHPALISCCPAPLRDILAFLNGELDDHHIARWTEALSLIGWHWDERNDAQAEPAEQNNDFPAIPIAYAALRSLLELECEWQGNNPSLWKKRRSQRPISLLCQQVPSSLTRAVEEAMRWISIWGVRNPWGDTAQRNKSRLSGLDTVRTDHLNLRFDDIRFVHRIAAATAIPLDWRGRQMIFRSVTLSQRSNNRSERNTA